jgi:hypothetical protein
MAGNHTNTSKNNIEVLLEDLGLEQYRNTTIFTKENKFILSPSIGNDTSWFDIRKVNLDRFTSEYHVGYLLIRFKEKLLICNLKQFIEKMIDKDKFSDTKNSGIHWQFIIKEPLYEDDCYKAVSRLSKKEIYLELVNREHLVDVIK